MKKITLLFVCLLAVGYASAQLNSVSMIGSGAGGWPGDPDYSAVDLNQMTTTDDLNWFLTNVTINGSVKFRGNNSWDSPYNWGTPTFPTGTAIVNNSGACFVPPGVYNVSFNSSTLAYSFTVSDLYPVISLIGNAVSDTGIFDVDYDLGTIDGVLYSATAVHLYPGVVKWRQDHVWSEFTNWGPQNWNSLVGTAVLNSFEAVNISAERYYNATFNRNSLAYTFTLSTIAIVGNATSAGWPSEQPGEIDPLVMSTTDGVNYTLAGITLTAGPDKALRFRADNSWNNQWGASTDPEFPSGIGTQGGDDINPDVTGNYTVSFNRETGAYSFTVLGVEDFNQTLVRAYPNPTVNDWNFSSTSEAISNIRIMDCLGKIMMDVPFNSVQAKIDASGLSKAMYFAVVTTTYGSQTIKVVKQ